MRHLQPRARQVERTGTGSRPGSPRRLPRGDLFRLTARAQKARVMYTQQLNGTTYTFKNLVDLMAKATPHRSGDELAGCAATSRRERAAAKWRLADVALDTFLEELVVPYEHDEVTRLIIDSHNRQAYRPVSH